MSKRFTDAKKWENEWFTDLPLKAKLAWIYICDKCEIHGVWKSNYKLATYQLGFALSENLLKEWFGNKVYSFDTDKILIVQFFEFQYGDSKDSWSAKIKAKNLLEALGFTIEKNKLINPNIPTVGSLSKTVLIEGISIIEGVVKGKGSITPEPLKFDFQALYEIYPKKVDKAEGFSLLDEQIKIQKDYDDCVLAHQNYKRYCELAWLSWYTPKGWAVFIGPKSKKNKPWREWIDPDPSLYEDPKFKSTTDVFASLRTKGA